MIIVFTVLWDYGEDKITQHSLPSVNVSCVDDQDDNVAIEGGSQLMRGKNLPLSLLQSWGKERVPSANLL